MKKNFTPLIFTIFLLIQSGCLSKTSATDAATDSTATTTGSGGTFTASDLAKSWTMLTCVAGSEPITNSNHYILYLTLGAGGSFNAQQVWYSSASCTGGNLTVGYSTAGTFTVGGLISGSSSLQSIHFTATSSLITAYNTTAQTSINSACGGTSPYIGGINSSYNGVGQSSYMMSCSGLTLPNSGNTGVDNIVGLSSGILSVGAYYAGIPGVFTGNTVPSSTSLNLN